MEIIDFIRTHFWDIIIVFAVGWGFWGIVVFVIHWIFGVESFQDKIDRLTRQFNALCENVRWDHKAHETLLIAYDKRLDRIENSLLNK